MSLQSGLITSLKKYNLKQFKRDGLAALAVTAVAVPESLGFATIVGLPLETGLYCALVAPIVFGILAKSKYLVVGADSATAALVAAGAATVAAAGSANYPTAVATLGILTGIILIVMGAARFGFLANMISRPVLIGLLAGIGIHLIISKIPELLGFETGRTLAETYGYLINNLSLLHLPSLVLGLGIILLIATLNRRRLPGMLIVLVGVIGVGFIFNLKTLGFEMIPQIDSGLPSIITPSFSPSDIFSLIPFAASIALIILAQSTATTRIYTSRHNESTDENRDLIALGSANLASALTHGFAINGSPPRTSISHSTGGRTQVVNILMAMLILLILLFATPILGRIPVVALAAIIIAVGMHLIKLSELRRIWNMRKAEFAVAISALLGVAVLGVGKGIFFAVILAIVERLSRQYKPADAVLLRDGKFSKWAQRRLGDIAKNHKIPEGLLIYRFGGSIFFENSTYFSERLIEAIRQSRTPVNTVVIDAGSMNDIDYTASETLKTLFHNLKSEEINIYIAHVTPGLHQLLRSYHLVQIIGERHIYPTLTAAISDIIMKHISAEEMVSSLKINPNNYVLIGGGVMDILGIRRTDSIDIVVSKSTYKQFLHQGWHEYIQDDGRRVLSQNGNQIMLTWMGRNLKDLKQSAFTAKGISCMGLDELLLCKQELGRPKDKEDIQLIKNYLKTLPKD